MNIAVWVVQVLLAVAYLAAGVLKTTQSREALKAKGLAWVEDFSDGTVKLIGAVEALGAIGLVLPAATGILPWLTPLAAVGLAVVQLLAIPVHLRRGEKQALPVNVVLLLLAVFVAWQRFGPNAF
ncbi:DoxX family protein [Phycicoccus avicenniae]|uniref:DoxX family protein n=1 Tax=Phycicoccus avicenniae TaxID=2828860 RepID=UPI003D26FC73